MRDTKASSVLLRSYRVLPAEESLAANTRLNELNRKSGCSSYLTYDYLTYLNVSRMTLKEGSIGVMRDTKDFNEVPSYSYGVTDDTKDLQEAYL